MEIRIFDVEQGFCAYVIADNGNVMLIDCGMNCSTGFRPSSYLVRNGCTGIGKLIITNFDGDHIADLPALIKTGLPIQVLTRNNTISAADLRALKLEGGPISPAMEVFLSLHGGYTQPVSSPPDFAGIDEQFFFNSYPAFSDTNNLSLVVFLYYQNIHIVFPGDVEKAGWQALLKNRSFVQNLATVNFFVAAHHGRDSGYCPEVFDYCKPELVIISDEAIQYDTQDVDYNQHVSGVQWPNERRYVLTTRKHGMITISQKPGQQGCLVNTAKG